jgi:U3 small nucleolar RNA-associated protein 20
VNHADFSVVEWTFNTLSWLLKYLSRQLVANLSSIFKDFAPLLGQTRQKQYVRRFASEAFAFLLRRLKEPNEIVLLMLKDVDGNQDYSEAVMNMFIESMKAPNRNVHSKAIPLFDTLVQKVHEIGLSPKVFLICRNRVCAAVIIRRRQSSSLEYQQRTLLPDPR